jgi:lysozyme
MMSKKKTVSGGLAAVLVAGAAFIGPWEGRELRAYQDIVGVWTICNGHTEGVKANDTATDAECDSMLTADLKVYDAQLRKMVGREMPPEVEVALLSWIYNVGPTAASKSTLVKFASAGNWVEACNQLPRWNRAGGKVVKGLTRRRVAEQTHCLKGSSYAADLYFLHKVFLAGHRHAGAPA